MMEETEESLSEDDSFDFQPNSNKVELAYEILCSGNCPANFTMDLSNTDIDDEGAKKIAKAFALGNFATGLDINLSNNAISAEGAKAIAESIISRKCPFGLYIDLSDNDIGDEGAKAVAKAVESGKLYINLHGNDIGGEGAKAIAESIISGKCSPGLDVDLSDNNIGDEGAKEIAKVIASGKCPSNLNIDLSNCHIGNKGVKAIAEAFASGKCPFGLRIGLSYNNISKKGIKFIAKALQSGNCPSELKIGFGYNNIDQEGIKFIAEALQSGNCPYGLHIDLSRTDTNPVGIKLITEALQLGNCPVKLKVDLSDNSAGNEGAKMIAEALQSGNCPYGLYIDLSHNKIGNEGAELIAASLQSENCPAMLKIDLHDNFCKEFLDKVNHLVEKSNEYQELEALNRFSSVRMFFMFTWGLIPKELQFFIAFKCLKNYDLILLNEKFTRMDPIELKKLEVSASLLRLYNMAVKYERAEDWFDMGKFLLNNEKMVRDIPEAFKLDCIGKGMPEPIYGGVIFCLEKAMNCKISKIKKSDIQELLDLVKLKCIKNSYIMNNVIQNEKKRGLENDQVIDNDTSVHKQKRIKYSDDHMEIETISNNINYLQSHNYPKDMQHSMYGFPALNLGNTRHIGFFENENRGNQDFFVEIMQKPKEEKEEKEEPEKSINLNSKT